VTEDEKHAALIAHPIFREAWRLALLAAAGVARDGCLVPPDGGSPTEAEAAMCNAIAEHILTLQPAPNT
jgi:hypothetical protein